jgi:uncharacterized protein (DUF1778 family)
MAKTITLRIDDSTYHLVKRAAEGDHRSIANFIEYATLAYMTSEACVFDEEMQNILQDKTLLQSLANGEQEMQEGKFSIVG